MPVKFEAGSIIGCWTRVGVHVVVKVTKGDELDFCSIWRGQSSFKNTLRKK